MIHALKEKGFSGTELVVLLALVGLLFAVIVPEFMNAIDIAKQKKTMKDMNQWGAALEAYYVDYSFYPYLPSGPSGPIAPGVFLYDMIKEQKYMKDPPYLDGWNYHYRYTAGGISMWTTGAYTITSIGKGGVEDAMPLVNFRCFQCDIKMINGRFFTRPVGSQIDHSTGLECPYPECAMPLNSNTDKEGL